MAMLLRADGTTQTLEIAASLTNAERLKLLQDTVGGWIEVLRLSRDKLMVFDEEGKLKAKPHNGAASMIASKHLRFGDFIVGDVLIVTDEEFEREEEEA